MQETKSTSTTVRKVARPASSAFAGSTSAATARSTAKFAAARRTRLTVPSTSRVETGTVTALKDAAPGVLLIGVAIAEALFIEPIRTLKRKFRGTARVA